MKYENKYEDEVRGALEMVDELLVNIYEQFINSDDVEEQKSLLMQFERLYTQRMATMRELSDSYVKLKEIDLKDRHLRLDEEKFKYETEQRNKKTVFDRIVTVAQVVTPAVTAIGGVLLLSDIANKNAAAQCAVEEHGMYNKAYGKNSQEFARKALNTIKIK